MSFFHSDLDGASRIGLGERLVTLAYRSRWTLLAAGALAAVPGGELWGWWRTRSLLAGECGVLAVEIKGSTVVVSSHDSDGDTSYHAEYVEHSVLDVVFAAGERQATARVQTAERGFEPGELLECWLDPRGVVTLDSPGSQRARIRWDSAILALGLLLPFFARFLELLHHRRRSEAGPG